MNTTITIPVSTGLHLVCEPGHEESLNVALAHLSAVIESINRTKKSPLLAEYIETVLNRFLRETYYSPKSKMMITSRFEKLATVLTGERPDMKVSDLDEDAARILKAELPAMLRKNQRSASQGTNVETYYRLFNRIANEALNDNLISKPIKIKATRTKNSQISKPFSDADLTCLYSGWPYQTANKVDQDAHSYRFWLMPLALFTGGRLNELCQLRVHDIIRDVHGVDLISINDHGHRKSIKNEQSRRQIPICSALKALGFLDFVLERRQAEGEDALLFPELTYHPTHLYSRNPSRFFCGPRTGAGYIGEHCPHTRDGGWNFKSFRRTFALRLEASGIPTSTIAYLLGHRSGSSDVTAKHYLSTPLSVCMLEQIELGLTYQIDLSHIKWPNYRSLLAGQAGRRKRGRRTTNL
ncbi:tyrosine-type recombinase/integrase [uncultured Pseudomonas sp.]|uniref:tyrosine-type recombinase/integrase n=1 Tax=uncultured Pseudomonas sp. TaxID=114707 RepID=UPI0030DAABBD